MFTIIKSKIDNIFERRERVPRVPTLEHRPFVPNLAFQMLVKTDNTGTSADDQFRINVGSGTFNYDVDWGDGSTDSGLTATTTHTYPAAGEYVVKITGAFPSILFNNGNDRLKLLEIQNWGVIEWSSFSAAFSGCANMRMTATDKPICVAATGSTCNLAFNACTAMVDENFSNWDLSAFLNIGSMFQNCTNFNGNVAGMKLNGSLSNMFVGCSSFTGIGLDTLDVSTCNLTTSMFSGCSSLGTVDFSGWNVEGFTNTGSMFNNCFSMNGNFTGWRLLSCTQAASMFSACSSFTGALGMSNWELPICTTMTLMFRNCTNFNGDVSGWTFRPAGVSIQNTFTNCAAFTGTGMGAWSIRPTTMTDAFSGCSNFNGNVGGFDTSILNSGYLRAFDNCTAFEGTGVEFWDTAAATTFASLFYRCNNFVGNVSGWNTGNVTNMSRMFGFCTVFNSNVSAWDVTKVTTLSETFRDCPAFSQDLGGWNVVGLTGASTCFTNSQLTTPHYDSLLIGWEALVLKNSVTFHAGASQYSAGAAATAKASIIATYTWSISDGGEAA